MKILGGFFGPRRPLPAKPLKTFEIQKNFSFCPREEMRKDPNHIKIFPINFDIFVPFQSTWIGETSRVSKKIWNCHEETKNGEDKTTCKQEGWHRPFNVRMEPYNFNIFGYINQLQEEQRRTDLKIIAWESGGNQKKQQGSYTANKLRIQKIVQRYSEISEKSGKLTFLRNVAGLLRN